MYTGTETDNYHQTNITFARVCVNLIIGETEWITRVIYIKIINSLLNTDGRINK